MESASKLLHIPDFPMLLFGQPCRMVLEIPKINNLGNSNYNDFKINRKQ